MSQGVRTPGPIYLFVLFRGGTTASYLGTCVTAPEPEEEKFKLEVMNDISGRSVPFQLVQDGEKWMILATMNRFNYTLVQQIRALESGGGNGAGSNALGSVGSVVNGAPTGLGSESAFARGTLVLGVSDFSLITLNAYYNTPSAGQFVGNSPDLAAGRYYYSCNLRKYKESTVGTRVLDVAMAIEVQNLYDPSTRGFVQYTEDPSKFPAGVSLGGVV